MGRSREDVVGWVESNRIAPVEMGISWYLWVLCPVGDFLPSPLRRWEDAAACRGLTRGATGCGEKEPLRPPMLPTGCRGSAP